MAGQKVLFVTLLITLGVGCASTDSTKTKANGKEFQEVAKELGVLAKNYDVQTKRGRCSYFSAFAQSVVKSRYSGVSRADMMDIASGNAMAEKLVRHAYGLEKLEADTQRMTEKLQSKQASKFGTTVYEECVQQ